MAPKANLSITGRINAYFFYQMYVDSLKENVCNKNAVDWCMKAGLISNSYNCPECKELMQLKKQNVLGDKWGWICRKNNHHKKRSLRNGTIFGNSNLSMSEILLLIWFWMNKYSFQSVMNEIGCSSSSVCEWYSICREVCIETCIRTSEKIGGESRVVEFEECQFGKRIQRKSSNQPLGPEGKWVYVGLERNTDKYFFVEKPARSKESLYQTLRDWILPGTTIISGCWSVHECLEDEDFQLLKDLNSLTFKSMDIPDGHDNPVGGGCSYFRRAVKGLSKYKNQYDGHLAEYMWRRQNKAEIQLEFVSFMEAIKSVYPPQTADV